MPKVVVWENVKNVIGKKHMPTFQKYLDAMGDLGYNTHYQVLNAKDYGIPQNRERVFAVSVLKGEEDFLFPQKIELTNKLKDYLIPTVEVDKKYYISEAMKKYIIAKPSGTYTNSNITINREVAATLNTKCGGRRASIDTYLCDTMPDNFRIDSETAEEIHEALYIKNATKLGYVEAKDGDGIDFSYPNSTTRRGRVQVGKSHTITTQDLIGVYADAKIRKFVPLETWRLMGFGDEDFENAKASGISDTQLYKQAGNSIVVNVLEHLFTSLFEQVAFSNETALDVSMPTPRRINEMLNKILQEKIDTQDAGIIYYVDNLFEERFKLSKSEPENHLFLGHWGVEESDWSIFGYACDSKYKAYISFGSTVYEYLKELNEKQREEHAVEYCKSLHKVIMRAYIDLANLESEKVIDD